MPKFRHTSLAYTPTAKAATLLSLIVLGAVFCLLGLIHHEAGDIQLPAKYATHSGLGLGSREVASLEASHGLNDTIPSWNSRVRDPPTDAEVLAHAVTGRAMLCRLASRQYERSPWDAWTTNLQEKGWSVTEQAIDVVLEPETLDAFRRFGVPMDAEKRRFEIWNNRPSYNRWGYQVQPTGGLYIIDYGWFMTGTEGTPDWQQDGIIHMLNLLSPRRALVALPVAEGRTNTDTPEEYVQPGRSLDVERCSDLTAMVAVQYATLTSPRITWIVHESVVNDDTIDVIARVYEFVGNGTRRDKLQWIYERGPIRVWAGGDNMHALMNTPNAKTIYWMLWQHSQYLGQRTVVCIIVVGEAYGTYGINYGVSMAFELRRLD